MKINMLKIRLEVQSYFGREERVVHYQVENEKGFVFSGSRILPTNDLFSNFDYLWTETGRLLLEQLRQADEQTEAQSQPQG